VRKGVKFSPSPLAPPPPFTLFPLKLTINPPPPPPEHHLSTHKQALDTLKSNFNHFWSKTAKSPYLSIMLVLERVCLLKECKGTFYISHIGEKFSNVGKTISHLGKIISNPGEKNSHVGKNISRIGFYNSHTGKYISNVGKSVNKTKRYTRRKDYVRTLSSR